MRLVPVHKDWVREQALRYGLAKALLHPSIGGLGEPYTHPCLAPVSPSTTVPTILPNHHSTSQNNMPSSSYLSGTARSARLLKKFYFLPPFFSTCGTGILSYPQVPHCWIILALGKYTVRGSSGLTGLSLAKENK